MIPVVYSENMKTFSAGLLLLSLVLFSSLHEGHGFIFGGRPGRPGHGFGHGYGHGHGGYGHGHGNGFGSNQFANSFYTAKWTQTGEVPNKLAQVPPAPLYMSFSGRRVLPNNTIPTEDMMSRPNLRWEAERGALYTIVLVDNGIERLEGQQYFHWLVSNVPNGYSVASGDEVREVLETDLPVFCIPR